MKNFQMFVAIMVISSVFNSFCAQMTKDKDDITFKTTEVVTPEAEVTMPVHHAACPAMGMPSETSEIVPTGALKPHETVITKPSITSETITEVEPESEMETSVTETEMED